jgi:hypothetical protein
MRHSKSGHHDEYSVRSNSHNWCLNSDIGRLFFNSSDCNRRESNLVTSRGMRGRVWSYNFDGFGVVLPALWVALRDTVENRRLRSRRTAEEVVERVNRRIVIEPPRRLLVYSLSSQSATVSGVAASGSLPNALPTSKTFMCKRLLISTPIRIWIRIAERAPLGDQSRSGCPRFLCARLGDRRVDLNSIFGPTGSRVRALSRTASTHRKYCRNRISI